MSAGTPSYFYISSSSLQPHLSESGLHIARYDYAKHGQGSIVKIFEGFTSGRFVIAAGRGVQDTVPAAFQPGKPSDKFLRTAGIGHRSRHFACPRIVSNGFGCLVSGDLCILTAVSCHSTTSLGVVR